MYVDAQAAYDEEWPTKYDDMFPYADNENSFWTGYFSSRADDKEVIRRASRAMSASNMLFSLGMIDQNTSDEVIDKMLNAKHSLLDSIGVTQHHDSVTGTAK